MRLVEARRDGAPRQGARSERQLSLFGGEESADYLSEQLITYIGNKRALLDLIGKAVDRVKQALGRERISSLDLFSGSGVVSRYLKRHSTRLIANDLEPYCEVISRCYLANASSLDLPGLRSIHRRLSERLACEPLRAGLIARSYAPRDDEAIAPGERVFYTSRNARFLDTARELIEELPSSVRPFFLAPLLSQASIHANTSGVFKGFYKNRATGIGQFGGTKGDALSRIKGDITLPFPVFSAFDAEVEVHREDSSALARRLRPVDLAYVDPPYNQHPYGSNYFMLNLLVSGRAPGEVSDVSGIPSDWNRSAFNKRGKALAALADLVANLDARYLLVSFSSEGFVQRDDMLGLLSSAGSVELLAADYSAFRGSRNLRGRDLRVTEYLYLLDRGR